ncbi:MAG: ABC transporter permease [Bacteroidaceae bacterium]|nr:ABC transporter permease [Bacteroidaceae bacterium]
MALVWKLLRQHISVPQFAGFFFANLVGMVIILLGIQFYNDTQAIYNGEDSFMKADYLIVNKKIGAMSAITGKDNSFSKSDIEDLKDQKFVEKIGTFTPSAFNVRASFNISGVQNLSTDMFFESVPDEFVDVARDHWSWKKGETNIPIILPKNYLDLYNFGYAQSRNMPKLSEGILGAMKLNITVMGRGKQDSYDGVIAGFSSRLNTILVPDSFMKWANDEYADGESKMSTRVIMQVNNPTDERITSYLQDHNMETDQDKLDASKTTFVLRVIVGIVMGVGLVISILSFYILMLSVYLLVQKNSSKLENLLLIGYSPSKVSLPYQALTVGLNVVVLILAFIILFIVRNIYLVMFENFFPDMSVPSMLPSLVVGVILLVVVSILNIIAVRNKVMSIWKRKD